MTDHFREAEWLLSVASDFESEHDQICAFMAANTHATLAKVQALKNMLSDPKTTKNDENSTPQTETGLPKHAEPIAEPTRTTVSDEEDHGTESRTPVHISSTNEHGHEAARSLCGKPLAGLDARRSVADSCGVCAECVDQALLLTRVREQEQIISAAYKELVEHPKSSYSEGLADGVNRVIRSIEKSVASREDGDHDE